MKLQKLFVFLTIFAVNQNLFAKSSPLAPVETETPRETMRSFMEAMNDYKRGVELENEQLKERIEDAVYTLDLSFYAPLVRADKGREAAIFLKETIDRVIVIKYGLIPNDKAADAALSSWRLKDTTITIHKVEDGERKGEYLFSPQTVLDARKFYEKVDHLPYLKGSGEGAVYNPAFIERVVPIWARERHFGLFRWQWIGLLIAFFFGLTGKFFAQRVMGRVKKIVEKSRGKWDDHLLAAVEPPAGLICASLIWFLALNILRIEGEYLNVLTIVVQAVFSFSLVWLAYRLAGVATDLVRHFSSKKTFLLDSHLEPLFLSALKMFIIIFGILISLQNLGINVMSLLAGLGLGGLAFALAAKDTAANVFGSIVVLWDKPFAVGDWVIVDGVEGTIERIGFRSTRIRTFYKSQVTVPNMRMAVVNIDNMGRRTYRRIKTNFGLTYDTPVEKIESFVEGVKNIVLANRYTVKNDFHVCFNSYGDSSLNVLLYCFLATPDWATELVEKQNLFLEIKRLAESIGVEFAFPTQTLHLESTPDHPLERLDSFAGEKKPELKDVTKDFGPDGKLSKPAGHGYFKPIYEDKS